MLPATAAVLELAKNESCLEILAWPLRTTPLVAALDLVPLDWSSMEGEVNGSAE